MQIFIILGILLFFPIIAFLLSMFGISKSPSKWRRYLPFYIYFIFIAAYSYTPPSGSNVDLLRYYQILEELKGLSLTEIVSSLSDSLYAENILYWIVVSANMPRLLQAITTATVYGVGAYIVCDSAQPTDYKFIFRVLMTQAVIIPFFSVVVNVRNVFTFSLIILASYRDLYRHRRDLLTILLYIIPVFMHKTGVIIVILRLLVPVFKRVYFVAVAFVFGLSGLIKLAYSYRLSIPFGGALGTILRRLVNSAYIYLLGETQYAERVRNSTGATLSRLIAFVFLIFLVYLYLKKFLSKQKIEDIEVMGYLLCILSLACNAFDTPAYWRFSAAASLVITPIMYSFYRGELTTRIQKQRIYFVLIIYLVVRALFTVYRATIDWGETVSILVSTNIFTLMFELIKSIFVA